MIFEGNRYAIVFVLIQVGWQRDMFSIERIVLLQERRRSATRLLTKPCPSCAGYKSEHVDRIVKKCRALAILLFTSWTRGVRVRLAASTASRQHLLFNLVLKQNQKLRQLGFYKEVAPAAPVSFVRPFVTDGIQIIPQDVRSAHFDCPSALQY